MPGRPYILAETTWQAVRDTKFEVAVLPWGATEAHNYHLPYATDQERPAAVEEDDRAQHRTNQTHTGEVDRIAEPVHHHVAGQHDRHRQHQTQPELAPERLRVVPGVLVMPLMPPGMDCLAVPGRVVLTAGMVVRLGLHIDHLHHGTLYPLGVPGKRAACSGRHSAEPTHGSGRGGRLLGQGLW